MNSKTKEETSPVKNQDEALYSKFDRSRKFRAWDKVKKIMWTSKYPIDQGTYWHIGNDNYIDVTDNNICRDSNEFIVIEFTGEKDKKGQEIFEGDVLRVRYFLGYSNEEVEFLRGCFVAGKETVFGWSDKEVIGNVFENPELRPGGQND